MLGLDDIEAGLCMAIFVVSRLHFWWPLTSSNVEKFAECLQWTSQTSWWSIANMVRWRTVCNWCCLQLRSYAPEMIDSSRFLLELSNIELAMWTEWSHGGETLRYWSVARASSKSATWYGCFDALWPSFNCTNKNCPITSVRCQHAAAPFVRCLTLCLKVGFIGELSGSGYFERSNYWAMIYGVASAIGAYTFLTTPKGRVRWSHCLK